MNSISGSIDLMCLFDDLLSYINDYEGHENADLLYDYDFWDLYFEFYEEYRDVVGESI